MAEYKPFLDELFSDAEDLMWELSDNEKGYFTSIEFIRRAGQKRQKAYIELLYAASHGNDDPFRVSHRDMGARLERIARNAGYRQEKDSGISDFNIWGDEDKSPVVYRRTDQVKKPS